MSKKASKRAKRRQQQASLPDTRREHLMHLERRGRLQTTPKQWQQRDPQPWYPHELGLTRDCWLPAAPRAAADHPRSP